MTGALPPGAEVFATGGRVAVYMHGLPRFTLSPGAVDTLVEHLRQAQAHARLQVRSSASPPQVDAPALQAEPGSTRRGFILSGFTESAVNGDLMGPASYGGPGG